MKIIEFFIKQNKIMNLIVALIVGVGVYFFINGQKEAFPTFTVNQIYINTIYPGANAKTIENQVTYPIEEKLKNLSGIQKIESSSRENISSIILTVDPAFENKLNDIKSDVQNQIDEIVFPDGTEKPKVNVFDEGLIPVIRVLVAGGKDEWALRIVAKKFQKEIEGIGGIGGVSLQGYRDEEIIIECNPVKLKEKGISVDEVINAVRMKNVSVPSGEVYQNGKTFLIRVESSFTTPDEIENIVIRANDAYQGVYVKDVAKVIKGFKKASTFNHANGQKGIEVLIKKNKKGDTIKISDSVNEVVKKYQSLFPDMKFVIYSDTAVYVKNRLSILGNNAFLGLFFVVLILFIFFDFATSFWTVLGMPVAFCTAIIISNSMGISLNLMSMFGFIIVVGMIVDDSIVIAENIYQKKEQGLSNLEACVQGTREVILPIFVSILTTIAAFMPLLLITGTIGKFFSVIPTVVTITLIASLAEALLVLPGHLFHIKWKKKQGETGALSKKSQMFRWLQVKYSAFLGNVLKHKFISLAIFLVVSGALMYVSVINVPFQFNTGRVDEYEIVMDLPPSYSLTMTDQAVSNIEVFLLSKSPTIVQDVVSVIGQESAGTFLVTGDNKATIRVILNPARPENFNEIEFRDEIIAFAKTNYQLGNLEVRAIVAGPPPKKAVDVVLTGENFNEILSAAELVKSYVATLSNTADVRLDYQEGKSEVWLVIDELKAKSVQLSPSQIAAAIRNVFDGGIATSIKEKGDEIKVRVKYDAISSATYKTLKELKIKNSMGYSIDYNFFGSLETKKGISETRHFNLDPTVSVLGNLKNPYDKFNSSATINQKIKMQYKNGIPEFPGVKVQYGGEDEDSGRTVRDILFAYLIAFVLIFIQLVALFKRYSQTLIVLLTIPFGLIGAYFGLFLNGMSLSSTAMIGIVALSGVVVNSAIIMIDYINSKRKDGLSSHDAIIEGSAKRLRSVVMTTFTTIVGLVPLAYGWGGKEEYLMPLGVTLVFGITFSTLLTLILVPVLYSILEVTLKETLPERVRKLAGKIFPKKA
ncbi:MAG: efflux RND transporter permease subunit [Brevinematales bacterium]|nr:efflux RND transporter permease subunit [Brevinematales bacterium]